MQKIQDAKKHNQAAYLDGKKVKIIKSQFSV